MSELLLDVSQMREAHARVERTVPGDALAVESELFRVSGPVSLAFDVRKDGQQYRLIGRVQAALDMECSRCLAPFTLPVDEPFDVLYLPHSEHQTEGEVEIEDDDLTTAFYSDQAIDLGQLMLEQFFMAAPMKPLCTDECQGLCPMCGTNRNAGACSCAPVWVDPRLAVLEKLKKDT